ncbi:class A sortase [Listeria newyorkensis]|uniref:Class A sortase n=1 Tax=Listeria newyorkensis TaxID=1497681 RepID=A0ABX4XNE7_9LIST|nr:class A sortase [Listeria newyorkensis]KGL46462.1 cysteine protease [Listeria newyorkensis]PNP93134.1 class A sortase [Listeria newyorkensis]WAO23325.1 class A sortase [Listeria newyorkensis]
MLKKTIAIIILIVGLLLVLSPFIKSGIVKYLSGRDSVTNYSAETLEKNNNRDANFDFASVELPSMTSVVKGAADYDKNAVVGSIAIPSVDLSLMVLKGTNTANLLAGATTMRSDQVMGKGNYPLAGHHMRNGSMLFGPVMNVKEGAKVYLTDLTNLYTYEVTNTKIVKDTEVGVIDDTEEPQITLVTCDVATETDQRFIATGKLVSTEKLTKEAKQKYFE